MQGVEASPDLISRVTDAEVEELAEWQSRPLYLPGLPGDLHRRCLGLPADRTPLRGREFVYLVYQNATLNIVSGRFGLPSGAQRAIVSDSSVARRRRVCGRERYCQRGALCPLSDAGTVSALGAVAGEVGADRNALSPAVGKD
jgi:hypothetical protein